MGRVTYQETSDLQTIVGDRVFLKLVALGGPQTPSHCGHAVKHCLQRWHGFLVVDCLLEKSVLILVKSKVILPRRLDYFDRSRACMV